MLLYMLPYGRRQGREEEGGAAAEGEIDMKIAKSGSTRERG